MASAPERILPPAAVAHLISKRAPRWRNSFLSVHRVGALFKVLHSQMEVVGFFRKVTLAGLEPAIFGSEDQRLIH